MKDNVIKVLKVEPKKKPEVCLLKNDLKFLQEAVADKYKADTGENIQL